MLARFPHFVDMFMGGEGPEFDLAGKHSGFVILEQCEKRHAAQNFGPEKQG
jgi:hypothetical protein